MLPLAAAEIIVSLGVFAMQEVPRGAALWTLAGIVAILAALPVVVASAAEPRAPAPPGAQRIVAVALGLFAVAQLAFAILRTMKPKVIDIGETTVAALHALATGGNPYALPIDQIAGGIPGLSLHGYKYLPVMLAVYAPLALAFGVRGIVLTNLALQGATAAALAALGRRGGMPVAGLAAATIYLSLPFPAFQLLARGVNDLVPVLPLLLALWLLERRPMAAGVLVGLSLAAKLMPGAAVLLCLVPTTGARPRYFLGVALGLIPILPFLVWSPEAFFDNIVRFNLARPFDNTSWMLRLPGTAVVFVRIAAVGALATLYARIWLRPPRLDQRCAMAAAAILVVFAVGPDMHHNYYLWFIPLLALLAARAASGTGETMRDTA